MKPSQFINRTSAAKISPVLAVLLCMLLYCQNPLSAQGKQPVIVNDVSRLNPIEVSAVITPKTTAEIAEAVKSAKGSVSVGGGRYSMGGQTATENTLQIDMRDFNQIIAFNKDQKEITVQAGATWRKVQEHIDPYNLSVKIMQSYANFTVGGALSVNAHGRYIGMGPIILSVKKIQVVLASGEIKIASPIENPDLFFAAIGGYGGIGVITEATLQLTDNVKTERSDQVIAIENYGKYFADNIRNNQKVIFHNAVIYPNSYKKIRMVSYTETDREITVKDRLIPSDKSYKGGRAAINFVAGFPGGKWIRQHVLDPIYYYGKPVVWRNYEASHNVMELEPKSREINTFVLQEYFVPVNEFDNFYPKMSQILKAHKVNVMNISVRHALPDPGSKLAWARTEVFAFVLYYRQGKGAKDKTEVKAWTKALIDASLSCSGTFYLPYQIHASPEQFRKAYPNATEFFRVKKQYDPAYKFRNKLWDAYYEKE
ncbi:MAG: FAD-binding oxidoreductase [Bacteroidota bacterium]